MSRAPGAAPPSLPLAATQEMQWELMSALCPHDPGASRVLVVDNRQVDGPLDRACLRAAFAAVTRRHDALRLVFESVGVDPTVTVLDDVEPPLEFVDLSDLTAERQRARVDDIVFQENRRCFDLTGAPAWHAWLVRLGPERHLLSLSFSHVVEDGASCRLFMSDLLDAYASCLDCAPAFRGRESSFEAIVAAQARRFARSAEAVGYWRDRLSPAEPEPVWLRDAPPTADLLARGGIAFDIDAAAVAGIRRLAWRARTTPFVALLAAYHLHLSVVTGKDETVIATGVDTRSTEAEKRTVMQFVTDVLVGQRVPDTATLADAVVAAHAAMVDSAARLAPYKAIARAVNPAFDTARPWPVDNLCDGHFYASAPAEPERSVAGLRSKQVYIPGRPPPDHAPEIVAGDLPEERLPAWEAWCAPSVAIGAGRDRGMFVFNDQVCPAARVAPLVEQYQWVVGQFASASETSVGTLRRRCRERFGVRAGKSRVHG